MTAISRLSPFLPVLYGIQIPKIGPDPGRKAPLSQKRYFMPNPHRRNSPVGSRKYKKPYFMPNPHRRNSPVGLQKLQKNKASESAVLEELLREVAEKTSPQAIETLLVEIREMEVNLLLEMNITT